jgi:hypothetical protein
MEATTVLDEAFDTANEEGSPDFEPIPAGHYVATIAVAKASRLKSGRGQAVLLTWKVQDETHDGRLIFDRAIVSHESEKAMKFGRQKLKDICDACGVTGPLTDLTVLLDKPCSVFVKIEHDDSGEYPPTNRIGRVKPISKPQATTNGKADFNDKIPF